MRHEDESERSYAMPGVTLAQLKAVGVAGAQARGLFFRWMIGRHAVESVIFDFAVEQFRAKPNAARFYALHDLAVNGRGQIAAINVAGPSIAAANAFFAAHPPGGAWTPGVLSTIFDAAQQDLEAAIGPLLVGPPPYDDAYNQNAPALVATVNTYRQDLQAAALALRNAGYNTADIGFIPPYQ
jgi:hypothetical protein